MLCQLKPHQRVSDKYKFVLLRQVLSGLLGTTAVGPNVNVTAQQIRQILVEFGVSGSDGPPIDIRTDAATEWGDLLRRSAINREFTLSRAGPQEHNVIGSAERGVREVPKRKSPLEFPESSHALVALVNAQLHDPVHTQCNSDHKGNDPSGYAVSSQVTPEPHHLQTQLPEWLSWLGS